MAHFERKAITRRSFMTETVAGAALVGALGAADLDAQNATDRPGGPPPPADPANVPAVIRALKPMTGGVVPISADERRGRLEKARRLMHDHGIGAVLLEGGSSLFYFTGVSWSLSERPFVAVIPARGELGWVCPGFEEARARELVKAPNADVRVWQEDESPYERVAAILKDRGVSTGKVGIEERLRFFIFDGVRRAAPGIELVSADPVTAGCRMIKSPAELAIMKRANEITLTAYKAALSTLHEGMSAQDLRRNIFAAYTALGIGQAAALVLFGKYTAFPHGTSLPQTLREGDVVLVDDGCSLEGYQSDVTRTVVFGKPTQHQRDVWNLEKRAQAAAFAAVKPGVPCEAIDAAARKVIIDAGYGPGYKVPGLPHRTGHGIGIDGHEWTYLVKGNQTPLAPGMCFSDEPMITNYAEFGIRLEDCFHVTENGAEFFTQPSPSIDKPFG
ncbi:MAG: M24 family metallopeptidase [Betaproteobacteria bacterium]